MFQADLLCMKQPKLFLNDLNLKSINDLPPLPEALPAEDALDQLEAG